MFKNMRARLTAAATVVAVGVGGFGVMNASAATTAPARPGFTVTCVACTHVQNEYAFRGALDAIHQGTAVNTPIVLWYETPTATDPGADLFVSTVTTAITGGHVNQSGLHWTQYNGDSVVRFKYDPYGNGGANTYVGLDGPGNPTLLALRADNPNSVWQEFIEVPVTAAGVFGANAANACSAGLKHCALIDVGQSVNTNDPVVVTDPGNAFTGSLAQQDVEAENINQFGAIATSQVWDFQN